MISIPLNSLSTTPLYEQIYNYIKKEILNGHLASGEKLPSTRNMASFLNVSRSTIDMAYGQLLSEGYVDAKQKRGYFINDISGLKVGTTLPPTKCTIVNAKEKKKYRYDFSPYTVDTSHFPFSTWKHLTTSALMETENFFDVSENQGEESFRAAIHTYLHQSRGVNCHPNQIIIGAGADYLLQLLTGLLSNNDLIAVEDPGYQQVTRIFESLSIRTISIPVNKKGMDLISLKNSEANIAYVTPSHQYPLGLVMPITQRLSLLSWANEASNRYLIEDDHDSEFRYVGKPIPCLQSIDTNQKVIYMGTFSKAISPAIRIAYMVLPLPLLEQYERSLSHFSSTVSRLDQKIMSRFMMEGYFERHLNKMRKSYKGKHDALLTALKQFGSSISTEGGNAGLHVIVTFHSFQTEQEILTSAECAGIRLYPLSEHFVTLPTDYEPSFLFGYADLNEKQISEGIGLLYKQLSCPHNTK